MVTKLTYFQRNWYITAEIWIALSSDLEVIGPSGVQFRR